MEQSKINSKARGITSQYLYAFYENELLYFDINSEVFLETGCFTKKIILRKEHNAVERVWDRIQPNSASWLYDLG